MACNCIAANYYSDPNLQFDRVDKEVEKMTDRMIVKWAHNLEIWRMGSFSPAMNQCTLIIEHDSMIPFWKGAINSSKCHAYIIIKQYFLIENFLSSVISNIKTSWFSSWH